MFNDNITQLVQPGTFHDQLTEVLRKGAHILLKQAIEAEVATFIEQHASLKTDGGHKRIERHGHLPEREFTTGIGAVGVRQSRVHGTSLIFYTHPAPHREPV